MKNLIAIAIVNAAMYASHFAYYLWPAGEDRAWAKYIGDGAGFALLCVCVIFMARGVVGAILVAMAAWGVVEGLQQYACGLWLWNNPDRGSSGEDLCLQVVGRWPYAVGAALIAAWLITNKILRSRNDSPNRLE